MASLVLNFFQSLFPAAVHQDFSVDRHTISNRAGAVATIGIGVLTLSTKATPYSLQEASWSLNPVFILGVVVISIAAIAFAFFERTRASLAIEEKLCKQLQLITRDDMLKATNDLADRSSYLAIEKLKNDPALTEKVFAKSTPSPTAKAILIACENEQIRSIVIKSVKDEEFSSVVGFLLENRMTPVEAFIETTKAHKPALKDLSLEQRGALIETVFINSPAQLPALIEVGFDPNYKTQCGSSLLTMCVTLLKENPPTSIENVTSIVRQLIELGADPTAVSDAALSLESLIEDKELLELLRPTPKGVSSS